MKTATRIKKMDWRSDAYLYRLSEPYEGTSYVIVSAVIVPITGAETYIFPAKEDGETISMIEMGGSFRGELNHKKALENAGYEVVS